MNNEKADRELPPRIFGNSPRWVATQTCLDGEVEFLSFEEHEAILREERANVWEEAANTEMAFGGYPIAEVPERIRNYFLEKAKEERENG